jgi:hypothetical protein
MQLRAAKPDCVVVPVLNGVWIPSRTVAERTLVARIIARMKADGQMMPGVADLLALWREGCGAIELKVPATRTLLGRRPAGRPSDAQRDFQALCALHGIPHVYAYSWDDVKAALRSWGRLQ